ncbi:MAG: T9SS type A sorting domain-containing protein [Sphingobacteriaceae bacterium]|nr:T9SS type A sorting domain-containing protein [Sphingobacteriaceae bacterium]
MKTTNLRIIVIAIIGLMINSLNAQTFTVGSASGNLALNCNTTVITMTTNSGYVPYSYTWTAPGNTLYGNYANISVPGTWTVLGQSQTSTVSSQQTFIITQNLSAPNIGITPTLANVTCTLMPSLTLTSTSAGPANTITDWYKVIGTNTISVGAPQGTLNVLSVGNPGVFWGVSINNFTGCKSTMSVQVTASVGVPTFSISSTTNFSLGCGSSSVTSLQFANVVTFPVSNPVSYTVSPFPNPATFTNNPSIPNFTVPVNWWSAYVKDLTSNCVGMQPFAITQNINPPSAFVSQPVSTISCFQPTTILTGITNNTNTTMSWTVPPSSVVNSSTVIASTNSAVFNSTNNITSTGVYTLSVTDNITQCVGIKTISVMQDIRLPKFTVSAMTNSVITCINPSVTLVPILTPTISVSLVPTFVWFAPLSSSVQGSSFTSTLAGSHTVIATSLINGCTYSAIGYVAIDTFVAIGGAFGVSCPMTTAVITPTTSGPFNTTYTWSGTPGTITSPVNQQTISVNALGNYTCIVSNTVNGCADTVVYNVVCNNGIKSFTSNEIIISVYPNPSNGILTIEVSSAHPNAKLNVFDVQGKLLLEKPLNSSLNKFETNLPKGFYLYRITSEDQVLKKDKLIIE